MAVSIQLLQADLTKLIQWEKAFCNSNTLPKFLRAKSPQKSWRHFADAKSSIIKVCPMEKLLQTKN